MKKLAILLLSSSLVACGGGSGSPASNSGSPATSPIINNVADTMSAMPNTLHATSVRVIDGDTVEILLQNHKSERVRLLGIDAPESDQAGGAESTENLKKCIDNANVMVKWQKKDVYDRVLGKLLANNIDCNLKQVEDGFAWHYKKYLKDQPQADQLSYANAEFFAKQAKKGLWADNKAISPWDWRKGNKSVNTSPIQPSNPIYPVNPKPIQPTTPTYPTNPIFTPSTTGKQCKKGKPCGGSCIAVNKVCHK